MIREIDLWLDEWAKWARGNGERLGYASESAVYRMMTVNAATTRKDGYSQKVHRMDIGGRSVARDIDPMRETKSSPSRKPAVPDNPKCEIMDDAVCHLENGRLVTAIKLRSKAGYGWTAAADAMRVSQTKYKGLIDSAHNQIDGYLRGRYPEQYKEIMSELRTVLEVMNK